MNGLFALVYGLAAYLIGMGALAWFVAFTAGVYVPRTVDIGPAAPWPMALATDIGLMLLFGLQHSLMARRGFKQWWTRHVPPAVERSTYLLATAIVLAILCGGWLPVPAPVLWQVTDATAARLLWAVFALGWLLVVASSYLINHFELFGLRQVWARWRGRTCPPATFGTPGLYRYVRHPLYVGILLGLWATPTMTAGHAVLATGLTAYILIGIAFEERDLVHHFGDHYRQYRRQVGMLVPRLSRFGRGPASGDARSPSR